MSAWARFHVAVVALALVGALLACPAAAGQLNGRVSQAAGSIAKSKKAPKGWRYKIKNEKRDGYPGRAIYSIAKVWNKKSPKGGRKAHSKVFWIPKKGELSIDEAFINGAPPLMTLNKTKGKGRLRVPTMAYTLLRQLRDLGIRRGSADSPQLKTVILDTVINEPTILGLSRLRAQNSGAPINELIRETAIFSNTEMLLGAMGYQITNVEVRGGVEDGQFRPEHAMTSETDLGQETVFHRFSVVLSVSPTSR